jgi:hypothetical protein
MSYYLFIDESGDHNLKSFNKGAPLFLLCGCILDFEENKKMEEKLRLFKIKHFGTSDVILHYREIRKRLGYFNMLMNKGKNDEFMKDLKELLTSVEYKIIIAVIDKEEHIKCYGKVAENPYELSLNFLIERFIFFIRKNVVGTKIIVEKRGNKEDTQLLENWVKIYQRGTGFIESKELQIKIEELKMHNKSDNIAGLQIADISSSAILQKIIKNQSEEEIFETIKDKIIFYKNGCLGKGAKVFPNTSNWLKTISSLL